MVDLILGGLPCRSWARKRVPIGIVCRPRGEASQLMTQTSRPYLRGFVEGELDLPGAARAGGLDQPVLDPAFGTGGFFLAPPLRSGDPVIQDRVTLIGALAPGPADGLEDAGLEQQRNGQWRLRVGLVSFPVGGVDPLSRRQHRDPMSSCRRRQALVPVQRSDSKPVFSGDKCRKSWRVHPLVCPFP